MHYGLEPRERPYLQDFSQLKDDTAIRNFFQQNHNLNRCALIRDGKLFGEVNTLTEPPLIHGVMKNLVALRYIQIFSRKVTDYFNGFSKVILFAPKQIQAELVAHFPQTTFTNVTDPEAIRKLTGSEADLIIDFLFGKKLLKKIGCNAPVKNFHDVMEPFAAESLARYAAENDLLLKFYKIPAREDLTSLSDDERKNFLQKKSLSEILSDESFLKKFAPRETIRNFIKSRQIMTSLRLDNGIYYTQEDCCTENFQVIGGLRRTLFSCPDAAKSIHFFGPCAIYGMMVTDDETIPTLFAKIYTENNLKIHVVNHGGLHGNNVLNTLINALFTPIRNGDCLIFLDFFRDVPEKFFPGLRNVADWFNIKKLPTEVFFLDRPEHCNGHGNKILAQGMFSEVKNSMSSCSNRRDMFTYLSANNLNFVRTKNIF